jgi:hypothetical protein
MVLTAKAKDDWILRNTMLMHAKPDSESSIRHKITSQKFVYDHFDSISLENPILTSCITDLADIKENNH